MSDDTVYAIKTCMNATDAVRNTLSRDTVALIMSHLFATDRLMWALACGVPFFSRTRFAKQARERGSFAQFLWVVKRGCIDHLRDHHKNVMHFLKHVEGPAGTKLVREYSETALKLLGEPVAVAKMNWLLAVALERDDDEFFKWCAWRLQYKELNHQASVIPKMLMIKGKVQLMQWLLDNGYMVTFGTRENVILAFDSLKHKDELIKFLLKENSGETKNHINIIVGRYLAWERWHVVEWLGGLGVDLEIFTHLLRYPYGVKDGPRNCSRVLNIITELELAYKFKCKLDPIWVRTLVDNQHHEVLQWLVDKHYAIPYMAMRSALCHKNDIAMQILAAAKLHYSEDDIEHLVYGGDAGELKRAFFHGVVFTAQHLKIASRIDRRHPSSCYSLLLEFSHK